MAGSTGPKQHPDVKLLGREQIIQIFDRFRAANPAPATELLAPNDYTLLVSVVLSAQATDKSVNKATAPLYLVADTPEKMLELGEAGLIDYIKSTGLNCYVGPFETTIEGESYDQLMDIVKECQHVAIRAGAPTVSAYIKVVYEPEGEILTIEKKVKKHHQE